jgi:predicted XRE-type DNA-binding protein
MHGGIAAMTDSGAVFAELEVEEAETHRLKAELVRRIAALVTDRRLTQNAAAVRMGLSQPDVLKMLQGQSSPLSLERLMRCLVALGQNVAIEVWPAKLTRPRIKMTVR